MHIVLLIAKAIGIFPEKFIPISHVWSLIGTKNHLIMSMAMKFLDNYSSNLNGIVRCITVESFLIMDFRYSVCATIL